MDDQAARERYIDNLSWVPDYVFQRRPSWMSDDQWDQAIRFLRGLAIPTDLEILSALRGEISFQGDDRCHRWVWSSTPAIVVGDAYLPWCELIRGKYDPDLMVAEGL